MSREPPASLSPSIPRPERFVAALALRPHRSAFRADALKRFPAGCLNVFHALFGRTDRGERSALAEGA
jgi:hypothetical protein